MESGSSGLRITDAPLWENPAQSRLDATSLPNEVKGVLTAATPLLQRHQLYKLVVQLAPADFPAALAALRESGGKDGAELYNDLAAFWFEKDLPSAKAWLVSLTSAEREKVFGAVLATWAKVNISDLFTWVQAQPNDGQKGLASTYRQDLVRLLAKSDPVAAAEFLFAVEPSPAADPLSKGEWDVFHEWGRRDPLAASRRIDEVPSQRRMEAMRGLVSSWTEQDPAGVEAWLATLTDAPLIREAKKEYISQRAELNPAAAADYMLKNWMRAYVDHGQMDIVISRWCRQDEVAALTWIKALPDPAMREQGLYNLFRAVMWDNAPHAAELWLSEYGDGANGSGWSSARYIARELSTDVGFNAAADFLAKVPGKDRALAVEQFLVEDVRRTSALDAAEAILRRPQTPERVEFIRPVFEHLAAHGQVTEARRLLGSFPEGAERQAAITGLVVGELGRDPERGFRLAQSLVGTLEGTRIVSAQLARNNYQHKGKLKEWLQRTSLLTPGDKKRILNSPENNGN